LLFSVYLKSQLVGKTVEIGQSFNFSIAGQSRVLIAVEVAPKEDHPLFISKKTKVEIQEENSQVIANKPENSISKTPVRLGGMKKEVKYLEQLIGLCFNKDSGIKPKRVLIEGSSGIGKTSLVYNVAAKTNTPLYRITGLDLVSKVN